MEGIPGYQVHPGFWLQITEGGRGSEEVVIRIRVRDLEAALARLHHVGLETGDVERVDGVIMFCDFSDPWGNGLGLYQVL